MNPTDERLLTALCDETSSTAEVLGGMGASADLIRVAKPSSTDPPAQTWIIELRPLTSPIPVEHRVKKLLKAALREFSMRCVSVRPGPEVKP